MLVDSDLLLFGCLVIALIVLLHLVFAHARWCGGLFMVYCVTSICFLWFGCLVAVTFVWYLWFSLLLCVCLILLLIVLILPYL